MIPRYVYRVQHAVDGRGPFRPGWTHTWLDAAGDAMRETKPSILDEFGDNLFAGAPRTMSYGTGVARALDLVQWFSPVERERLAAVDYIVVRMNIDIVVASSPNQIVFGRLRPLADGVSIIGWRALE